MKLLKKKTEKTTHSDILFLCMKFEIASDQKTITDCNYSPWFFFSTHRTVYLRLQINNAKHIRVNVSIMGLRLSFKAFQTN